MVEAQEIATRSTDWVLLVLLMVGFFLTLAKLANTSRFQFFLKLPFDVSSREWASVYNPFFSKRISDFLMSLSALLSITLAIFFIQTFWEQQRPVSNAWLPYLRVLFFTSLIYLLKTLLGSFIAAVFEVQEEITAAQNINLAFLTWLVVPIYPLLVVTAFAGWPQAFWPKILLILLALGALLAFWQTARTVIKIGPALSYNIFYLCALEISPIIFLILVVQKI